MSAISPIPKDELNRLAQVNATLVEVARRLLAVAEKQTGTPDGAILQAEIGRLLDSSNSISRAIRSTEEAGRARA